MHQSKNIYKSLLRHDIYFYTATYNTCIYILECQRFFSVKDKTAVYEQGRIMTFGGPRLMK